MTTAVCCEEDEADLLKVVSGVHDLEDQTEESETLIESVTIHEDYDGFNLFNNICMMKLQAALASERWERHYSDKKRRNPRILCHDEIAVEVASCWWWWWCCCCYCYCYCCCCFCFFI